MKWHVSELSYLTTLYPLTCFDFIYITFPAWSWKINCSGFTWKIIILFWLDFHVILALDSWDSRSSLGYLSMPSHYQTKPAFTLSLSLSHELTLSLHLISFLLIRTSMHKAWTREIKKKIVRNHSSLFVDRVYITTIPIHNNMFPSLSK